MPGGRWSPSSPQGVLITETEVTYANGARARRSSWRVAAVSHVKGHTRGEAVGGLGSPSRCSGPPETKSVRHGRAGARVHMLQNKLDKEAPTWALATNKISFRVVARVGVID